MSGIVFQRLKHSNYVNVNKFLKCDNLECTQQSQHTPHILASHYRLDVPLNNVMLLYLPGLTAAQPGQAC